MKCCGQENCVSTSCHPYESCIKGGCSQQKIECVDGFYPVNIPSYVFESDLEFAVNQGARAFYDIWHRHNWDKKS
jgi:hypothetical protein